VNLAWTVAIVVAFGWTLVSILVALAFGGMARSADAAPSDLVELTGAPGVPGGAGGAAAPLSDEGYRAAV
jgi:hypothetical protein